MGGPRPFFDIGLGGAVNNGCRHSRDAGRKNFGSNILFHASGKIGRRVDVSLYFDHSSDDALDRDNQSLNGAGLRVGWHF